MYDFDVLHWAPYQDRERERTLNALVLHVVDYESRTKGYRNIKSLIAIIYLVAISTEQPPWITHSNLEKGNSIFYLIQLSADNMLNFTPKGDPHLVIFPAFEATRATDFTEFALLAACWQIST